MSTLNKICGVILLVGVFFLFGSSAVHAEIFYCGASGCTTDPIGTNGTTYADVTQCRNACPADPASNPMCARGFRPACNFTSICKVYGFGINLVTIGAVMLTLVMVLYASYKYISARGVADDLAKARTMMIYSFTGLLFVVFAYAIVRVIFTVTSFNAADSGVAVCF